MKLFSICSFLMLTVVGSASGQTIMLGAEGNIGFYSMASLKEMQVVPANHPLAFKSVQNFPATPGMRVQVMMKLNHLITVGIFGGGTNTGSRLTYSDHTGQAYRDVVVSTFNLGLASRVEIYSTRAWSFYGRFAAGPAFNKIAFESRINLVDDNFNVVENSRWKSTNYFLDLGAEVGYTWKRIYIKAFASQETGVSSEATFVSGSTAYPENRTFAVEWDGTRIGLGLEYQLKRFEK